MRLRYSSVPVISAPHGMALGGGCEIGMHSDKVIAHAETYMGLVEFGVGLIPGGGGTKEFVLRLSDELKKGDVRTNAFTEKLGFVLAGGEISQSLSKVSEQYLLNIERKAFVELCMQKKTLERIQSLITKGKILRN